MFSFVCFIILVNMSCVFWSYYSWLLLFKAHCWIYDWIRIWKLWDMLFKSFNWLTEILMLIWHIFFIFFILLWSICCCLMIDLFIFISKIFSICFCLCFVFKVNLIMNFFFRISQRRQQTRIFFLLPASMCRLEYFYLSEDIFASCFFVLQKTSQVSLVFQLYCFEFSHSIPKMESTSLRASV